ncbi:RluA family pseudouridine synthase [uncultured Lutibacter sp.]|uniref:RluA family pseudouridine synthase n=1 Tax=uncultured Lutibacter sp. TaxID=437739 RepID=UPI00262D3566|nr:RluA family pseudouridine synthase [uncultured Lutibacter sp.]
MNGAIGHTYSWIQPGQILELLDDPKKKHKVYKYRLEIVYEDEHIAAINKPAGITVSGNAFKTISNALTFNLKESNLPDALAVPTPVHRLDNQTSGILLVAKTKNAQIELGKQFSNQSIQKTYSTIAIGEINKSGIINSSIENKTAITNFEIISIIKSLKYKNLTCLKVFPKTGRTHQIRIHLSSIGHSILGDKLYGNKDTIHKGKGLFLSATEIIFLHPKTMAPIHLKIEIPNKFKSLLEREKRRWNTYNK